MHDAPTSLALLAVTIIALLTTRARSPLVHVVVESVLLIAIGAFLSSQGTSPLPHLGIVPVGLAGAWDRALAVVWWLISARLAVNVTAVARGQNQRSRQVRLFSDLSAAIIYITAILIILNSVLGLNITSLVATSGVIAIVLGLALQSTLADVFSGIAVGLERPFHVGDRVSLGDNIEGTVVQMNWRSVRIQTDGDDTATIPNSLVSKGQIINHSVPTRHRSTSIEIVAPTEVAPATVLELMRQATLLCPTLLTNPAPSFALRRSGMQTSTYATGFHVADSPAVADAKSMLLRQTRRMFRHAGVGRPAPVTPAELLSAVVLFEALSADEIAGMVANLVTSVIEPGDTIFEQGDVATSFYIIEAGVIEIARKMPNGPSQTIGRIGPGEYIGEIGLITGSPRAYTMKALTHARIAEVSGKCLKDLLKANKALHAAMERSVRRGLDLLDRDDAARAVEPAEHRTDLLARMKAFFGLAASTHSSARHSEGV